MDRAIEAGKRNHLMRTLLLHILPSKLLSPYVFRAFPILMRLLHLSAAIEAGEGHIEAIKRHLNFD